MENYSTDTSGEMKCHVMSVCKTSCEAQQLSMLLSTNSQKCGFIPWAQNTQGIISNLVLKGEEGESICLISLTWGEGKSIFPEKLYKWQERERLGSQVCPL
jgi:hypothetical protein